MTHPQGAPRVLKKSKASALRFKYNELQVSMAGADGADLTHVSAVLRGIDRLAERGALIGGCFDVQRYVTRMETTDGEALYLKLTFLRSWFDLVKDLFRPSRARREQNGNELVRAAGLRSLRVVAVGEKRRRGVAQRSLVVTLEAEGIPLDLYLESLYEDLDPAEALHRKRDLIARLAVEISRLHAEGLCHGDLRPNNILVRDTWPPEFVFIDNERTRRGRGGRQGTRRNFLQINFFFSERLTLTDRLRFLRAYSGPGAPKETERSVKTAGGGLDRRQRELARWVAVRSKQRIIKWFETIEVPVDRDVSYAALIRRGIEVQAERRKRGESTEGSIRV